MTTSFLHGVEVLDIDTGFRPIRTVRSGVIGLIGTAPDADANIFPLDTPVLVAGSRSMAANLGGTGTLPAAMDGIFDSTGAVVIVVRVDEGANYDATLSNVVGSATGYAGVHAFLAAEEKTGYEPKILCAPGFTSEKVDDGVTSITLTNQGSGYTSATVSITNTSGTSGAGATAEAVIANGQITAINVTNGGEGYTAGATVTITGDGTAAAATANVGDLMNPTVSELLGIAQALRAVIIADGPNTTDEAAIQYTQLHSSDRIYVVDPQVRVYDSATSTYVNQPASARVAGLIAKMDDEKGFWWSPSNQVLNGIVGTARTVPFQLGSTTSAANLLNENEVATIIRQNGFRLWGNRTTSMDAKWAFLSVRRTADMINESVMQAHLWAVDRCINRTYLQDVREGVNAYIRTLVARGAILGGNCWVDPEQNTPADIADGHVTFDFDFTPCYPAERVTFRSILTNGYITSALFD